MKARRFSKIRILAPHQPAEPRLLNREEDFEYRNDARGEPRVERFDGQTEGLKTDRRRRGRRRQVCRTDPTLLLQYCIINIVWDAWNVSRAWNRIIHKRTCAPTILGNIIVLL